MARQRKLSPERKAFINSLLEHYQPTMQLMYRTCSKIFSLIQGVDTK